MIHMKSAVLKLAMIFLPLLTVCFGAQTAKPALAKDYIAEGSCGEDGIADIDCTDDVQWVLKKNGTMKIFGNGEIKSYEDYDNIDWRRYRKKIKKIVIKEGVTGIGYRSFMDCTNLKSLEWADSVKTVNGEAFGNCTGLKEIYLPATVERWGENVFLDCTNLEKVTFAEGFQFNMGEDYWFPDGYFMFKNCKNLKEVCFPNSLENVPWGIFEGCGKIKNFHIPKGVVYLQSYPRNAGMKKVVLPSGVEEAGGFWENKNLTEVVLPQRLQKIYNAAFLKCPNLKCITIPKYVKSIGSSAFYGCKSLKTIIVQSELLESVGEDALKNILENATIYVPEDKLEEYKDLFRNKGTNIRRMKWKTLKDIESVHKDTPNATYRGEKFVKEKYADSGNCGKDVVNPQKETSKVKWKLKKDGTFLLYGKGDMKDFLNRADVPWKRSAIKKLVVKEGVTGIGTAAFWGCDNLVSIRFADSVVRVGNDTFYGCTKLKEVTLPDTVTDWGTFVFSDCISLKKVKMGDKLQFTKGATGKVPDGGAHMFDGCVSLKDISLPDRLKVIPTGFFTECKSVKDFEFPTDILHLGSLPENYNQETLVIPDTVKTIGNLSRVTGLKQVFLPAGLEVIGACSFMECENLEAVSIPDNVKQVDSRAFYNCRKLKSVKMSSGIKGLGAEAFANCTALETFDFPENSPLKKIEENLFYGCQCLQKIEIPQKVEYIEDYAFKNCTALKRVEIKSTKFRDLGIQAFANCTSIENVNMQAGPKIVHTDAFLNCKSLKSIVFPVGTEAVYARAFKGCENLETVDLPESVINLRFGIFNGCPKLHTLIIRSRILSHVHTPIYCPEIGDDDSMTGPLGEFTIYVPYGKIEEYQSLGFLYSNITWKVLAGTENVSEESLMGIVISGYCGKPYDKGHSLLSDLKYNLYTDGTMLIYGEMRMAEICSLYPLWNEYKQQIKRLIVSEETDSVAANSFYVCSNLEWVQLPDSLLNIGSYAFANCTGLKEITIPKSVTTIEKGLFKGCTSLESITIESEYLQNVEAKAIEGIPENATVYVPEGKTKIYKELFREKGADVEQLTWKEK